ncbi:MAG: fibrobacter succinogenes major paralogous domain-containing protein [Candidatus Marinimicrobia bacterium]|nr:fibrobacter succinogenes major paralogous domain-containing protein [Candidatus Neomarinimicrobiota bacterium]
MYRLKFYWIVLFFIILANGLLAVTGDLRVHQSDGTLVRIPLDDITTVLFPDESTIEIYHVNAGVVSPYVAAFSDLDSVTFEKIEGHVIDIDGNNYKTVKINNSWWMAKNLQTTCYNDGSSIPNVTGHSAWLGLTTGAYCIYNDDNSNTDKYGFLYNWYAVNTGKLAPAGWHVPSQAEGDALKTYLGTNPGHKLKSIETADENNWRDHYSTSGGGSDIFGFRGLPAGDHHSTGYTYLRENAYFWTSDQQSENTGKCWKLNYNNTNLDPTNLGKNYGMSVRCVRD